MGDGKGSSDGWMIGGALGSVTPEGLGRLGQEDYD